MTSTEFDILANRIGTLSNLTTTHKDNCVNAINDCKSDITGLADQIGNKIISTNSPTVQQLKDAKEVIVWLASSDNTQHNAVALKEYYWNQIDLGVWTGSVYQHTYCQVQWNKTNGMVTVQTNSSERGANVTVSITNYILLM